MSTETLLYMTTLCFCICQLVTRERFAFSNGAYICKLVHSSLHLACKTCSHSAVKTRFCQGEGGKDNNMGTLRGGVRRGDFPTNNYEPLYPLLPPLFYINSGILTSFLMIRTFLRCLAVGSKGQQFCCSYNMWRLTQGLVWFPHSLPLLLPLLFHLFYLFLRDEGLQRHDNGSQYPTFSSG